MWPSTTPRLGRERGDDEQSAESYAATLDTNVLSNWLSMKHELRVMLPQGGGA